ncbi:MAG: NAD(P)/FAD-dependent oxidoreductase [Candidatus Alkanophagales archaeon]
MREERYDVVVVGAGPGGSTAARVAAEHGLDVLLIERNQEIGVPVRCAEGVSKRVRDFVSLPEECIAAEASGARIFSPDGTCVELSEKTARRGLAEVGYVLERKLFDKYLARLAADRGVEVRVKTQAVSVLKDGNSVRGVVVRDISGEAKIFADIVIAADGVESRIGRMAGLETRIKPADLEVCAQFYMTGIDVEEDISEFYLGNRIAPGGYAWVFPKGERSANVGVGIEAARSKDGARALDYLKAFVRKKFPEGRVLSHVYGAVPVSGPIKSVADGIILVGDAARQTDPLTGGGILNAMEAGKIAGEVAAEAFKRKDFSEASLREYEVRCRELNERLMKMYRARLLISKLGDEELNALAHSLEGVKFEELNARELLKELIKRNPRLLMSLAKLFL